MRTLISHIILSLSETLIDISVIIGGYHAKEEIISRLHEKAWDVEFKDKKI